ncbi:MAG: tetratricopeptide repeat protein [Candidatus Binatia bacterium]|nr:tetratricopeptide repeat protein [Candidatus Binatia bacterium]
MTLPVGWFSGFPNVAAHFEPMQKRPSFKKLLCTLLLLAILYLLGTSSFAASNPFDDAIAAYERGDYVQGMKLFRQLAAQGHQWAQRRLGLIYAEGRGVPQDYQEAVKWYRLAAAQGNVLAQYSLGLAYEKGKGVPQDYQEAVRWFRLAAAQGYAPAQSSLGLAYEKGQGVPQDYQEAVKWYRLAAAQGNQFGQINLGVMYTNGTGVRQDFVRAHMWFTLAAAALSGDSGDTATKNRDGIASKMTAEQIATAQEIVRRCQESKLKNCD